jgi:hypothetical protein
MGRIFIMWGAVIRRRFPKLDSSELLFMLFGLPDKRGSLLLVMSSTLEVVSLCQEYLVAVTFYGAEQEILFSSEVQLDNVQVALL